MDITLAIFSWAVTILFPLVILSIPVSLVLEKAKKGWKDSKAERIYKLSQKVALGVTVICLLIALVLMFT